MFKPDLCSADVLDIRQQIEVVVSSQETERSGNSDVRCLERKAGFPLCTFPPVLMVKVEIQLPSAVAHQE